MKEECSKEKRNMDEDNKNVKLQLIKTINNIKKKYKTLQQESQHLDNALNIKYKPIIAALDKVGPYQQDNSNNTIYSEQNVNETPKVDNNSDWNPAVLINKLIDVNESLHVLNTYKHDNKYGINLKRGKYFIGKAEIQFNYDRILVRNEVFQLTNGLLNLLILKSPEIFKKTDLNAYKRILILSELSIPSINKKSYSKKFKNIIYPMFKEKEGRSLQTDYMEVIRSGTTDYKYWDDANELVDRLRLLIASQTAGHTGHNNEIIAIIEELREARIIQ